MCRDPVGALAVEVLHRAGISTRVVDGFGGYRVNQMLLDLARPQVRLRDAARDAAAVARAVIRHHICLADDARRLDRDELGVTGPQPHPPQRALGCHAAPPAIAFTAAAAIALPPRRPVTSR